MAGKCLSEILNINILQYELYLITNLVLSKVIFIKAPEVLPRGKPAASLGQLSLHSFIRVQYIG